jgi:cytochrome c551/c552
MVVSNLRKSYIHTIKMDGVRDQENAYSLVHPTVYYTLNNIPEGTKLAAGDLNTLRQTIAKKSGGASTGVATTSGPKAANAKPTFAAVKPLLDKYTCTSCHNVTKKQVGPSFTAIAARDYSIDKMIDLIYNPKPSNWPDYAVAMPPMPQVPKEDARKIVSWIKSLTAKKTAQEMP